MVSEGRVINPTWGGLAAGSRVMMRAGLASGSATHHNPIHQNFTRARLHAGRGHPFFSPNRSQLNPVMLRYTTEQSPQKWTRSELMGIAGVAFLILCIWGVISWRHYQGDETQHLLAKTRAELVAAKEKIGALTGSLTETQKQLDDANNKIMELTSVAARAPRLPVSVRQWRDGSTTYAIALQNDGEQDISVHVTVTNPDRSRSREQDCYIPAHKTINTPLRIYPHDTAIVAAEGFATKTQRMD